MCIAVALGGKAFSADVELISEAAPGLNPVTAAGFSANAEYSPDGRFIAFASSAGDLVTNALVIETELFLLDTTTANLQLVSVNSGGSLAAGNALGASISADNRYIAFQSDASNLAPGDTNLSYDIFLRDLVAGATTLVSQNAAGTGAGNASSQRPEISANGEWVVFESYANNLSGSDTNAAADIFAWHRADGALRLVSAGINGKSANSAVDFHSITPDSKSVLFAGAGASLVANRSVSGELYLHDLASGTNRLIGAGVTNLPGFAAAYLTEPTLSENGRYVLAIAPLGNSSMRGLVRIDLTDDSVALICTNSDSQPFFQNASADGQYVAYSRGTNVYRWSAANGTEVVDAGGDAGARVSDSCVISHDGSKIAFLSDAGNLVPGVDAGTQLYLRDMNSSAISLVSHRPNGAPSADFESVFLTFSPDDKTLVFETGASDIVANDINNAFDIFKYDIATGGIGVVSESRRAAPIRTARGGSFTGRMTISADGRYVSFLARAQLNANDTNQTFDAYVRDRVSGTTILASVQTNGFAAGNVFNALISADGHKVVFDTASTNLAGPADTRTGRGLYLRDLVAGTTQNISPVAGQLQLMELSADGRYVFYIKSGAELRRFDLQQGNDLKVGSQLPSSPPFLQASSDGTRVVYLNATVPFYQQLPGGPAVSLNGFGSKTTWLSQDGESLVFQYGAFLGVTNFVTGATAHLDAQVRRVALSSDGRIVAFESSTSPSQVYFWDQRSGVTGIVSHVPGGITAGNGASGAPVVSADGRFIAFESWASDLVPADNNQMKDVFVYDRLSDKVELLSHAPGASTSGNQISINPTISADGNTVLFLSNSSDFVSGDFNEEMDIFSAQPSRANNNEDTDGDGLPDLWERAAFSSLQLNGNDDPDHDGMSNATEFSAGTDPGDALSALRIMGVDILPEGSRRIRWVSGQNRHYIVEAKEEMESPWILAGEVLMAPGAESSVVDPTPAGARYYRVRLMP